MNEVFYTVQVGDCDRKFREGTTYLDIAKEYQHEYEHDIVLVFVDGRLQELFKTLKKDIVIAPLPLGLYKRRLSISSSAHQLLGNK